MSDSDLFAQTQRAEVACLHCRMRKSKCLANSQHEPCLRCQTKGLVCEYVSTEKQKARGPGGKAREPKGSGHSPSGPFPPGSPNQLSNAGGGGQIPFYRGYDNSGSSSGPRTQFSTAVPPPFGGNPYTTSSNPPRAGPLLSALAHMHRCRPTRLPISAPGPMHPVMHPGTVPPQQKGYPTNYTNNSYDRNASSQSRMKQSSELRNEVEPALNQGIVWSCKILDNCHQDSAVSDLTPMICSVEGRDLRKNSAPKSFGDRWWMGGSPLGNARQIGGNQFA
ncbi:hypothetical protein DFH08DRAFT_826260 [Mycena albidolilacea]|uniref:Zn(2)-C6 fungal-type domain-containing protein n=1 Tax=Mycena albidolilacea TaxID=1033008 RepID=A0AAD6Z0J7_9AGAR|nr:hypothetical protein DFH08DRAFT_826260 [Mycena albidolilacea]